MQQMRIDSGVNKAIEIVKRLWFKFDIDMSGYLDQNECLKLLSAVKGELGDNNLVYQNEFAQFFR